MKRRFINDIKTFIILILLVMAFFSCMVWSLTAADDKFSIIAFICVFGGFLLLTLFCLLCCTEIIIIYDDKIVSKKVWNRKEILYADIVSMEEAYDMGAYATGMETGWKITDSSDQYIFLVSARGRKKDVDFIKQHTRRSLWW